MSAVMLGPDDAPTDPSTRDRLICLHDHILASPRYRAAKVARLRESLAAGLTDIALAHGFERADAFCCWQEPWMDTVRALVAEAGGDAERLRFDEIVRRPHPDNVVARHRADA